jgi:hypothetical protein
MYTARDVEEAKQVKLLARRLGYPTPANLIKMINAGAIVDCPVAAQAVCNAYDMYGPDLAAVRGKTVKRPSISSRFDPIPSPTDVPLSMCVDIMFVDKSAYFISVTQPLGLTMITELGRTTASRAKDSIRKALISQMNPYKARGFIIKTLLSDGEGAMASLTSELEAAGIIVNPVGPGQHVHPIERKIREVKEHARGIFNTLPFRLASFLLVWLLCFVVSRINMIPHRGGPVDVAPREAFYGSKNQVQHRHSMWFWRVPGVHST